MQEETIKNQVGKEFADEEVNIKEIFNKAIDFFWETLRFWWLIVLIASLMALKSYRSAVKVPKTYRAVTTYMVSDKKEEIRYSDYASLDYGISERASIKYNLDKIIQLTTTMRVIRKALMQKVVVDDTLDILANHVIREYNLNESWEGKLKNFYFEHDTIAKYDRIALTALKNVYFKVVGKSGETRLVQTLYDSDSGILSISAVSTSELLSIALSREIFFSLGDFYILSESEKQRKVYEMVREETDSLRSEIVVAKKKLLSFIDQNMGLSRKQYEAKKTGLEDEFNKLSISYGESYKNLQSSEMALLNTIPFIQEIDLPVEPIRPTKPSPIKAAITSGALWAFLTVLFVVIRRVILNILDKDQGPAVHRLDDGNEESPKETKPGLLKKLQQSLVGLWQHYRPLTRIMKLVKQLVIKLQRKKI